ncbi:MAG: TonB-dependent receptor [Chitinophagaceae bacterium]|nr:TonB-dependent receptor [Chitinophagaceae bacterium]
MTKTAISPKHPLRPVYKALMLMNGITLFFLALSLQVSATGFAQDKINLEVNGMPLTEVLKQIENNSVFRFVYSTDALQRKVIGKAKFKKAELSSVMEYLLDKTSLTYKMINDSLVSIGEKKEGVTYDRSAELATIKGTVTDEKGNPLAGVSVSVSGTKRGAIADEKGNFTIDAQPGATLEFSIVGYKTYTVKIGNATTLNVKLSPDASDLNNVVVVGYGTQKKKDLTGSIASVSSDQMNLGGATSNAAQAIQGRASGVQVSQTNAAPGGQTIVRIRGGNSIKSTNEPLYVVDGFPSETGIDIAPGDIEDIQILKDASATAIYGARGANGVVMITTKRGKAGKPVIQYDGYYGTQKILKGYDKMTGLEDMQTTNAKAIEKGNPAYYSATDLASGINNNWFELATRVAAVQSHSLSVSGGNEDTRVSLSGNYFSQEGALKKTDYDRYSVRLNVDKKFSNKFKMGANIYVARSFSKFKAYDGTIVPSNVMYGILVASPAIPAYNADGSFARFRGRDNPLAWLLAPTNDRFGNKIDANAFAEYEIIKGLSLRVNGGTEYVATKEGTYLPTDLVDGEKVKGKASVSDVNAVRNLVEAYFTYQTKFAYAHSLSVTAGVSSQSDVAYTHYTQVQKFSTDTYLYNNLDAGTEKLASQSSRIDVKLASAYGRLNYAYNDKYLVTFTLRRDGSSRFGANNRFGYFPSGSLAWRASNEEFIKSLNVFSNLKFRVSYGVTGNDRIGNYIYMSTFGPTNVTLDGQNSYGGVVATRLPNANLKWESTSQFDVGVDMGFFDNRLGITVDYYKKKTKDLLLDIPIGDWQGFSTQTVNAGAIDNRGIELSINTENIRSGNLKWNTTLNFAYNKQVCIDLGGRDYIITQTANPYGGRAVDFTKLAPGKELSMFFGYEYAGVIKAGETYSPQPDSKPGDPKYVDMNKDGKIDANDRTYLGNANPHYIYGLNNDFSYKGIELTIFFQGAADFSLYNANRLMLESGPGKDALKRWTTTNDNTDIPRDGYAIKYGGYINSRFIEKASYVRCKMITLGYNLPLANTFLRSIRNVKVYGSVQNLFTITKYKGSDPEVNTRGGDANLAAGLDYTAFPAYRSVTFGLKLNF